MNNAKRKKKKVNSSMGKMREIFKKTGDIKGTFHARMGMIKDRNGKDLTEAKEIRRGGKNIQKNCTDKVLMTLVTTMMWSLT